MLSTIRSSPKMLIIGTPEPDRVEDYLNGLCQGIRGSFIEVFDATQEEDSIVILTQANLNHGGSTLNNPGCFSLKIDMETLLCGLLTDGINVHIRQIRMAPRMILLRSMGDLEKSMEVIRSDYPGESGTVLDLMNRFANSGGDDRLNEPSPFTGFAMWETSIQRLSTWRFPTGRSINPFDPAMHSNT